MTNKLILTLIAGLLILVSILSIVNPIEGDYIRNFDIGGSGAGNVFGACAGEDVIYLNDATDDMIYVYWQNGTFNNSWSTSPQVVDGRGCAWNGSSLFIQDAGVDVIYEFLSDGTYTGKNFSTSSEVDDGLGIAVDNSYFYVHDETGQEIFLYYLNGTYAGLTYTPSLTIAGIAMIDGDYIWFNFGYNAVTGVSKAWKNNGTIISTWNRESNNTQSYGITMNSSRIWIVDIIDDLVYEYAGPFFADWIYPSFSNYSDNNGTLSINGTGIFNVSVIDTNGTVFFNLNVPRNDSSQQGNYTGSYWDLSDKTTFATNGLAIVPNESGTPMMHICNQGQVGDGIRHHWVYYMNGSYAYELENLQGSLCYGLAWDGTWLYSIAEDPETIYKYYPNGTYTTESYSLSEMSDSGGLAVDDTYLYALEITTNNHIYVYYNNGTYTGNNWATIATGSAFAITAYEDYIYVANSTNIAEFNKSGTFMRLLSYGLEPGNTNPSGMAINDTTIFTGDFTDKKVYLYKNQILQNNTNFEMVNTTLTDYSVTYNFSYPGVYYYQYCAYGNGANNNLNCTGISSYSVNTSLTDEIYPSFSNYSDNSPTNQLGKFNVSVIDTNTTVLLNINNTSVLMSNPLNYDYITTYNFTSSGNYSYNFCAYGNGTLNNLNCSSTRYFIYDSTLPTAQLGITQTSPYTEGYDTGFNFDTSGAGASNIQTGIVAIDDKLYMCDSLDDLIYVFYQNGTYYDSLDISSLNDNCGGLAYDGTYLYSLYTSPSPGDGIIYRLYLNGSYANWNITESVPSWGGEGLAMDNQYFYIADETDSRIYRYLLNGTEVDYWSVSPGTFADGIAIYGDYAYLGIGWYSVSEIRKVYKNNGTFVSSFNRNESNLNPRGIATNGKYIWVTQWYGKTIWKYVGADTNTFIPFVNDSYFNNGTQNFSVNVTDNFGLANVTVTIKNITGSEINKSTSILSGVLTAIVGVPIYLIDGIYTWFADVYDTMTNHATTPEEQFTIDTTSPLISYGDGTLADYSNVSQDSIYVNTTWTEANFQNISFDLYSGTLINSSLFTAPRYDLNFTGITDGDYIYNVTITDKLGNSNSTESRHITLDTTYPTIDFVAPTDTDTSWYARRNVIVNVSSTDTHLKDITIELRNGSQVINYSTTLTSANYANFSVDDDGDYYFNATACDYSGNCNVTATREIHIDTFFPIVNIIYPEDFTNYSVIPAILNITLTDTGTINNCWFSMDYGATNISFSSCSIGGNNIVSNFSLYVAQGTNNVFVWANDSASLISSPHNHTFYVDSEAPNATIVIPPSPPSGSYTSTSPRNFTINATDKTSGVKNITFIIRNESNVTINETTIEITPPQKDSIISMVYNFIYEGLFYWYSVITDAFNNVFTTSTSTVTYDITPPSGSIIYPLNTTYDYTVTNLTYIISELHPINCWYSIDFGATNNSITCGNNVTGLSATDGSHTFMLSINDSVGFVNTSRVTFLVDTLYPKIVINSPISMKYYNTTSILVNLNVTDANLDSVWYDDSVSNTYYTSPAYHTFAEGNETIIVYANDSIGHLNSSQKYFIVDITKPSVNLFPIANLSASTVPYNLTINYTISDLNINNSYVLLGNTDYSVNAFNFSTSNCYQEFANDTSCGNTAGSSTATSVSYFYPEHMIDGDWNSYAQVGSIANVIKVESIYNLPAGISEYVWQYRIDPQGGSGTITGNITIPSYCVSGNKLNLSITATVPSISIYGYANITCDNYLLLQVNSTSLAVDYYIYEEALYWIGAVTSENLTYSGSGTQTRYLKVPANASILTASINLTGIPIYNGTQCYQNLANYTTGCTADTANGSYAYDSIWQNVSRTYDGDFTTFSFPWGSPTAEVYANYTIPDDAGTNAVWKVRDGLATRYIDLNHECVNKSKQLSTKVISYWDGGVSEYIEYYCYNSTSSSYSLLQGYAKKEYYEGAIYWNMTYTVTNVSLSLGATNVWNYSGEFRTTATPSLATSINDYLSTCTAVAGYCYIPFNLYSDTMGILGYSGVRASTRMTIDYTSTTATIEIPVIGASALTLFAEDKAGNINNDSESFYAFHHSYTQDSSADVTTEGSIVNFNLTLNMPDIYSSTARLVYDGAEYDSDSFEISGHDYIFRKALPIPIGSGNATGKTIQWSWKYSISGFVTNATTINQAQTVFAVFIDDCSNYTDVIFNWSLRDEASDTAMNLSLNPTVEVDLNIVSLGDSNIFWQYNKTWSGITGTICVPSTLLNYSDYQVDVVASYIVDTYAQEFWYLDNGTLQKNNQVLDAYTNRTVIFRDLPTADSTTFLFSYVNKNVVLQPNSIVTVFRKYIGEGIFMEVERGKADNNGESHIHLVQEDVIYYFLVTLEGETLYESSEYNAKCLQTPCSINLQEGVGQQNVGSNDYLPEGSYSVQVDKDNRDVNVTFNLNETGIMNLSIYEYGGSDAEDNLIDTSSVTAKSGIVGVSVPFTFENKTYYAVLRHNNVFVVSQWADFTQDPYIYFGALGIFLASLLVLTLGLIAVSQGGWTVVFIVLGLIIASITGLLKMDYYLIIWIVCAGGILVWKLASRRSM